MFAVGRGLPVVFFAEQIGHDVDVGVARVVEAREAEACLEGLEEGEAGVVAVSYTHLDVYKRQPFRWRR